MNIHEHQAKALLAEYGLPILAGRVAFLVDEAVSGAEELGGPLWVVKAQIHAGGRGKGGGVRLARSLEEVREISEEMLGMQLVTHQTGPAGKIVHRLYIEDGCEIADEMYLSLLIDRATGRLAFIASTEGGVDIEGVAAETPEKIVTTLVDLDNGMASADLESITAGLGLVGSRAEQAAGILKALHKAFVDLDTSLIEINPLVVTTAGQVLLLDAKVAFDDNALFRHQDIIALRDESEEDPAEREAQEHDLSYIKLDGNIGCMVNGAGLAMATMDIIKLKGGAPANFLDVGGGADRERVTEAFKIILSDDHVEAILINIFGGIMRCDVIAQGVIDAAREVHLEVPLVVRLEGTNVEKGREILAGSGLTVISANDLDEAAEKVVAAVRKAG
jgi:succinyl-CoA synthetase beta subunit